MNYFNYFSEIEETFNRRRGKYGFLSPLDWALIEAWQEKGVPLHVVLRGIEKVFDGVDAKPNRRRHVKSLTYCREEIEAQYDEWLERQVGKHTAENSGASEAQDSFSPAAVREHLQKVSAELKAAAQTANEDLRDALERVAARLAELEQTESDTETLENSLSDLEKIIDEALIETADAEFLEKARQTAALDLAAYKNKMEKDVYERTFDLMILKRLRERAAIPRLSLFYL